MEFRKVPRDFEVVDSPTRKPRGRCQAKFCRGKTHHHAKGNRVEKYCPRCKARKWKQSSPIRYALGKLRTNAKRRGISFDLTFQEWQCFVLEHDLLNRRGRTALDLSVDRKRSSEGYHKDNLQILTVSLNSQKGQSDEPF